MLFTLFLFLGAFGGLVSGLLGVGGAVVMIPLMLNIPALFGFATPSMQAVSGLSIVQVFFASVSGMLRQRKNRMMDRSSLLLIGIPMAAGSLAGAALSAIVGGGALLVVFGVLTIAAAAMMLQKPPIPDGDEDAAFSVNKGAAILIGSVIGLLSGLVGAGGGFILIPLMIYVLRMPTRKAVGTSLGIVFIGSISGMLGKAAAGQIDWFLACALVLGAVPAAQFGAMAGARVSPKILRTLLVVVILIVCVRTWQKILFS